MPTVLKSVITHRHFFFYQKPRLKGCNNRKPLSVLKPQYRKLELKLPQNRTKITAKPHHHKPLRPPPYNREKNPCGKARNNNKPNPQMTLGRNQIQATLVRHERSHHNFIYLLSGGQTTFLEFIVQIWALQKSKWESPFFYAMIFFVCLSQTVCSKLQLYQMYLIEKDRQMIQPQGTYGGWINMSLFIEDLHSATFTDHSSVLIMLNSSAVDVENKHGTKTYSLCSQCRVQSLRIWVGSYLYLHLHLRHHFRLWGNRKIIWNSGSLE